MPHKITTKDSQKPLKMAGVPEITKEQLSADAASFEPYRKQLYGEASLSRKEMSKIARKTLDGLHHRPPGSR